MAADSFHIAELARLTLACEGLVTDLDPVLGEPCDSGRRGKKSGGHVALSSMFWWITRNVGAQTHGLASQRRSGRLA